MKVYQYSKCSTCRKALKFLNDHGVAHQSIDIVDRPPTLGELRTMLGVQQGQIRKLFNTSGEVYREMKLGERLGDMSESDALKLLSEHGKLVKRPFVISESSGLLGFNEQAWKEFISHQ